MVSVSVIGTYSVLSLLSGNVCTKLRWHVSWKYDGLAHIKLSNPDIFLHNMFKVFFYFFSNHKTIQAWDAINYYVVSSTK